MFSNLVPLKLLNPITKCFSYLGSSRIIREDQLPANLENTVIDPNILKTGTRFNLPASVYDPFGREITFLQLPPLSPDGRLERSGNLLFMHPISALMNAIVTIIATNGTHVELQQAVDQYYMGMISRLASKKGILAQGVAGTRLPFSGRLVLIPTIERAPEWVGISAAHMKASKLIEGDYVIIFRDPVIWIGSMEIVKIYPIEEDVIALHPLLFSQLGADCDGDMVMFVKPDMEDPEVVGEINENFMSFCRKYARWPKYLCPDGLPEEPDWNDIVTDSQRRFRITGQSYGPRDVAGWKKVPVVAQEFEHLLGKQFAERNKRIAENDTKFLVDIILQANYANVYMKRYLGIVGALARRLLVLAGEDPVVCWSVNRFSEIIQQGLLDVKHDGTGAVDPLDLRHMFERTGRWRKTSVRDVVDHLKKIGLSEKELYPLVIFFFVELPYRLYVEENVDKDSQAPLLTMLSQLPSGTPQDLNRILEDICKIQNFPTTTHVRNAVQPYALGLTDTIEKYYPGYAFIGRSARKKEDKLLSMYATMFQQEKKDRGSLVEFVLDDWDEE